MATDYNDRSLDQEDTSTDLGTASLNCVRGAAAYAIAALLWESPKYCAKFSPIIDKLVRDQYAIVRHAILEAVIAAYNVDRERSIRWFFTLINIDERIARHYRAKKLFFTTWKQCKIECMDVIQRLFFSENSESSEFGAFMATNLLIIYSEGVDTFRGMIFSGALTEAQIKGCAIVAVGLMEYSECHEPAKAIIEELIKYPDVVNNEISRMFYRDGLFLSQDVNTGASRPCARKNRAMSTV